MNNFFTPLLSALMLCCALPAMAQATTGYDSAFTGYKPYQEPKVADWKLTNAAVTPAGKSADPHAGHDMSKMNHDMMPAKPQATPKAPPPKKTSVPKPAAPDPHAGHHNH